MPRFSPNLQSRPPGSNDGQPSNPKSRTTRAGSWSSGLDKARLAVDVVKRSLPARQRAASLIKSPRDYSTGERSQPPPAQDVTQQMTFEARRPFAISPSCDLYKARHKMAGDVVVRRIRFQDDEDFWDSKLLATAARLVQTQNEHVLPYIGTCGFEGSLCLVSPLASGGDLRTHLQTCPGCDRMSLVRQVADGLAYLHGIGLVHGNIHTRNILLEGETVKLSDFGLSTLIPADGTTSMRPKFAREKALYCAPELHGGGAQSMSCDVYSFGMLVFHVYCGREPMIDAYPQAIQVVAALLHGRRPERQEIKRSDFTEHLWSLSQRCWARDAMTRPTAAAIRDELLLGTSKPSRRSWTPLGRK